MKKTTSAAPYPNETVAAKVAAYSEQHSTALPKHILDHHAWVAENHERAGYVISNFQAQLHVFLVRATGAKRILEIGSFVGYSALVWAHAVGDDGKVTGLEYSEEYAAMADDVFRRNGVKNVEIIRGDALENVSNNSTPVRREVVPGCPNRAANPLGLNEKASRPWSPKCRMTSSSIDAQKSGYPSYLADILAKSQPGAATRLLRPGGIIVADNVLRRARVVDESADNPWATPGRRATQRSEYEAAADLERLREFNDALVGSERLEAFLMPLYDGIGMARLVD